MGKIQKCKFARKKLNIYEGNYLFCDQVASLCLDHSDKSPSLKERLPDIQTYVNLSVSMLFILFL